MSHAASRTPLAPATRRALAALLSIAFFVAGIPPAWGAQANALYPEPSAPDSVAARVGNRVLSLAYFVKEWNRLTPNVRPQDPDPKRARALFLEDLVSRHLLAIEASRDTRPLSPAIEASLVALREENMRNRLYERVIVEPVRVEQVDLDLFTTELTKILELRGYLFPDREAAQAWHSRLVSGTPISRLEEAARRADAAILRRVDYGFVTRRDMRDSLARVVFRLPPGRVSAPTPIEKEWGLFQVVSTREQPPGVDLGNPDAILEKAREFRVMEAREVYREKMRDSLGVRYDEVAIDTLVNRFLNVPARQGVDPQGTPTFNVFLPLPTFTAVDSALAIASVGGREIRGRDILSYLSRQDPSTRPEIRERSELRAVVDRVAFDEALLRRAYEMGLDRDVEVQMAVERRREGFLVERMFQDSVSSRVQVHTDTLRIFFDQNKDHFQSPAHAKAWILVTSDRETGDSLLAVARGGADLAELARLHSNDSKSVANGGVVTGLVRGDNPNVDLDDSIFTTPIGEFGGPIQTQDSWVIFQVQERSEEKVATFEDALMHVSNDYKRIREERELLGFLDRLHARVPVETHPERVRDLPL